jgi:hypothetical protein
MSAGLAAAVLGALVAAQAPASEEIVQIRWVRVHSIEQATRACREVFPHWPASGIGGCYYRAGEVCHVVAPDPAIRQGASGRRWYEPDQWAALGHEVKHCFDGRFHD